MSILATVHSEMRSLTTGSCGGCYTSKNQVCLWSGWCSVCLSFLLPCL